MVLIVTVYPDQVSSCYKLIFILKWSETSGCLEDGSCFTKQLQLKVHLLAFSISFNSFH